MTKTDRAILSAMFMAGLSMIAYGAIGMASCPTQKLLAMVKASNAQVVEASR